MADGNPLPSPVLKAPKGQAEASGRNPYLDLLLSAPQLKAPSGPSEERTLSERWRLNLRAGQSESIGGAVEANIFDPRDKEVDLDNPGSVADHLRGKRIREMDESWNAMRPARTPAEIAVGLGGFIVGTAMSPETFVGLPTRFVTSGVSALSRVLRAGVSGGAINAVIDPVIQGLRIKAGLQKEYSPTQTGLAALLGIALPATVQTGIEALKPRTGPGIPEPRQQPARTSAGAPAAAPSRPRDTAPPPAPQPLPSSGTSLRVADALSASGRKSLIPGMGGQIDPDPIAQTILNSHSGSIESIENFLSQSGITSVKPLSGGTSSVVLDAGQSVVRLGEGDVRRQPVTPHVLKPSASAVIDGVRVEIMPKVDTNGITDADVVAMQERLAADGFKWDDAGTDQLGRLPDGRLVVIDGQVTRTQPDGAPRAGDEDSVATGAAPTAAEVPEPPVDINLPEMVVDTGPDIAPDLGPAMPPTAVRSGEPHIVGIDIAAPNRSEFDALTDQLKTLKDERFVLHEAMQDAFDSGDEAAQKAATDAYAAKRAEYEDLDQRLNEMVRQSLRTRSTDAGGGTATELVRDAVTAAREPSPVAVPDFTPSSVAKVAPSPGASAGTFLFDANDLNVDAITFQFKSEGDAEGVTPILRGVTKWDPSAAGQVLVWQRRDGTLFIADGHQRMGLAKRLLTGGQETDIKVPGILYREADGFSPQDVMISAAVKNIKEGSGSIIDAAKILRLEPDRIREIEEIGRAQTRQAVALARVSDEVWRMAINDVIDPRYAAVIGSIIPDDHVMQEAAAKALVRMNPANEAEASVLVRRVRESELVKTEGAAQGSLLDDFESPESTVVEEVRIVSRVVKTLAKDKNIMKRVAANAEAIERVGSTIARQETLSAADESGALARIVESVAFSKGEAREALLELAKELKNGSRTIGDATEAFIVALRRAETISSKRGGQGGAGRPAEQAGGQDTEGSGLFGSRPEPEPVPEAKPEVASGTPIKVAAGDLLQSQTGRGLAPVPKLDFSTEGKAKNSLKRIDAWLVDEAIKEAEATGNDFVLTQMRGLDPKALSPADRDAVNLVVFGNAEGATNRSLVPVATDRGPEPEILVGGRSGIILSALAKFLRQEAEFRTRSVDGRTALLMDNETIAMVDGTLTQEKALEAVSKELRDSLRSEGKTLNPDPLAMSLDEFTVAYKFRNLVPEFEFGIDEFGTVVRTNADGTFSVDIRNLYEKFRREAEGTAPRRGEMPMMSEEPGADGKPQLVLPGAERVPEASLAQRRADAPMRPRVAQKREAGPLFDDGAQQIDLLDLVRMAESKELPFSQRLRGKPMRGETARSDLGVPMATATPQAERLRVISDRVSDALGLTVRQGRIQTPGALGVYKTESGVVRLKELDAFDVLAHEGGHGLHLIPANRAAVDALIDAHAVEVERLAYQGAKPGTEREEGFAEWFRLWMTNPGYAQREAPGFADAFEGWLRAERPQIDAELRAAQDAYRDWLQAPSRQVLTGDLVSSGAPPIITRVGRAVETDRTPSGESLMSLAGRFYTWTIDRLHPVNKGVRALLQIHQRNTGQALDLKAASDPYKLLRLATSAHQAGHIDLIQGVVPYRRLDPEGPSLAEALEIAVGKNWYGSWRSDEMIDFGGYLVARRSIVEFERFLAGEVPNPPGKLTLGDYRQALADYEAAFPNFRAAAEMIYEWNRNILQKKYDAGLVSMTYFENALAKPDYVPFRRDFSEKVEELIRPAGPGGTNRQNIMKQYRGSLRSIINPIESMMSEAYSVAAIIARNDAIAALADLAAKAGPGGGAIAEHIPTKQLKPFEVDVLDALRKAGKDAGLDRAEIDDLILAASERLDSEDVLVTLFRAGDAPEKGEPIVYYWRGGQRYGLRLADKRFGKDLYEAITQIGTEQSNWIINMLAIPARTMRMGITTSPEFLLANYLRDQIAAFVLNTKFIPLVSGARGVIDEVAQTRTARLYAQAGGIMGGANVASLDQARIGRSINALRKKGYTIKRFKDPRELLKLTEVSETGTRVALFRQYFNTGLKQGLSEYEAMVEAAFQARDFIDFGRHGSKMLFARRIVTFLNAALQGSDKTARTLVGDLKPLAKVFRGETMTAGERALVNRSAQAWLKISALTALSATYALTYRDDPEWQQASEYLRATHWLFKLPGGKWAALPKPYEMATFMNFGERMAEGLASDDPTWADKWMRSWAYTLAIPVEPAGLMVPAEIGFNYDTFRDKPIVQQWDLGLEPWQQFYDYTSEFSKAVGKAINVSPAKVDHLLVGWGGSWARNLLAASNSIFDPQRRSDALYDWPVTGRFVKNLARGSDATDKFYGLVSETSGRLERKNNAHKEMIARGQEDEASKFYGSLKDDEKVWVSLNQHESADEKRVHPLRRASDILRVYSGMRKDIANRNVVSILGKRKIDVNATITAAINDQLGRAATAETRNAMIVIGEPGWAGREIMETAPYLEAVRQLSPEVAGEIEHRLRKAKVLPFEGVRLVWPELRRRLLEEGKDAFILDLRSDAMSTLDKGAPWREPEVQRDPLGLPTGVKRGKKVGQIIRGEDGRIQRLVDEDGRVLAEVKGRNEKGRITRVRVGIRDRAVRRGQDERAQQLA